MSKREKALMRLLSKPADSTWNELRLLMEALVYELKTSAGSGRKFIQPVTKSTLFIHEPHPSKALLAYQVKDAIDFLRKEEHIS